MSFPGHPLAPFGAPPGKLLARVHSTENSVGCVAIVIPAHNCAEYLPMAVESVMRQTYADWRLFITDDGSTDGTASYLNDLSHPSVHVIRNEQAAGPAVARNQGILASQTEFVAFLDADDEWAPDKLQRQVQSLREDKSAVLSFTDYSKLKTTDGTRTPSALAEFPHAGDGDVFDRLLKQNFVLTSSVVVRREALARSGIFDHRLRYGQDYDLWLRVARVGPFRLIPESLATYRLHGENNVLSRGYAMLQPLCLEMAIEKHSDLKHACREFRAKLGRAWHHRARTALHEGNFAVSRSAYWRAARYGHSPLSNLARAMFSLMPSPMGRGILKAMGKFQGGKTDAARTSRVSPPPA